MLDKALRHPESYGDCSHSADKFGLVDIEECFCEEMLFHRYPLKTYYTGNIFLEESYLFLKVNR